MDKLSTIWKSDKIKREFFQAEVVSVLLYRWTTWTWMKRLEKKLNRNYKSMLHTVLNKSYEQHFKKQLYSHLPQITQTIQDVQAMLGERRPKQISPVNTYTWTHHSWVTCKELYSSVCAGTGCYLEDLPRARDNRDGW